MSGALHPCHRHLPDMLYGLPALALLRHQFRDLLSITKSALALCSDAAHYCVVSHSSICAHPRLTFCSMTRSTTVPIQVFLSWRIKLFSNSWPVFIALVFSAGIQFAAGAVTAVLSIRIPECVDPPELENTLTQVSERRSGECSFPW